MTIDGYLGMGLILIAFFIANLSAAHTINDPWPEDRSNQKYITRTIGPVFICIATGTALSVMVFLIGLLMPHIISPSYSADPKTYGLSMINAKIIFYVAGVAAVFAAVPAQISTVSKILEDTKHHMVPTYCILLAFMTSGPIYALLLMLLAAITPIYHHSVDFAAMAPHVIVGAVLAAVANYTLRNWFTGKLEEMQKDEEMVMPERQIGMRAALSIAAFAIPAFSALFLAAG
jgi:hypothetical protein